MKTQINLALFLVVLIAALFGYISIQRLALEQQDLGLKQERLKSQIVNEEARLNSLPKTSYTIVHNADGRTYLLDSSTGRTWEWEDGSINVKVPALSVNEGWHQVIFWSDFNLAYYTPTEVTQDDEEDQKRINVERLKNMQSKAQASSSEQVPKQNK